MEQNRDNGSHNMAEKVISQLGLFLQDLNSFEYFSLIPSTANSFDRNVSPVQYVEAEHCLGLESWCVPPIYKHSQVQILKLRKSALSLKRCSSEEFAKLNLYLNVALLIQPDVNTFWNIKRELNELKHLDCNNEMQFAKLVLSHKPKSLQAFTYRVWLINKQQHGDSDLLAHELDVINKAVTSAANNYHGWNHRIWCMEHVLRNDFNIILNEFSYSLDFINQHVSEHSGFHYRQFILHQFKQRFSYPTENYPQLVKYNNIVAYCCNNNFLVHYHIDGKSIRQINQYLSLMLYELLEVCEQLNIHYLGHEAIWYHRRFIFYEIITLLHDICSSGKEKDNCNLPKKKVDYLLQNSILYNNIVSFERNFMNVLSTQNTNNVLDASFLERHQKWLKFTFNLDLNTNIVLNNGEVLF